MSDFPAASYDAWKTRSPDDDWYDDDTREDDCEHDDYEADILTGIAMCYRCGHRWMQTNEEVEREIERQAEYQRMQKRWNREQWWRDLYYTLTAPLRPLQRLWARRKPDVDDEIPF